MKFKELFSKKNTINDFKPFDEKKVERAANDEVEKDEIAWKLIDGIKRNHDKLSHPRMPLEEFLTLSFSKQKSIIATKLRNSKAPYPDYAIHRTMSEDDKTVSEIILKIINYFSK